MIGITLSNIMVERVSFIYTYLLTSIEGQNFKSTVQWSGLLFVKHYVVDESLLKFSLILNIG